MTQFQVRPTNEAESAVVQRAMFVLGYKWGGMQGVMGTPANKLAGRVILAGKDGTLLWMEKESRYADFEKFPLAKIDKLIDRAIDFLMAKYLEEASRYRPPTRQEAESRARAELGIQAGGTMAPEPLEMSRPEIKPYTPFWMVYRIGGNPPRVRHQHPKDAEVEAKRLAEATPGETFVVLAPVAAFMASRPVVHSVPQGEIDNPPPF